MQTIIHYDPVTGNRKKKYMIPASVSQTRWNWSIATIPSRSREDLGTIHRVHKRHLFLRCSASNVSCAGFHALVPNKIQQTRSWVVVAQRKRRKPAPFGGLQMEQTTGHSIAVILCGGLKHCPIKIGSDTRPQKVKIEHQKRTGPKNRARRTNPKVYRDIGCKQED